jgi:arabinofuranosyltransferase
VSVLSRNQRASFDGTAALQQALVIFPWAIAAAGTLGVVSVGWIADDGYITARYADNLLHGYGPVFNPGEHVQGFTHPLWLLFLTLGQAIFGEPLLGAVALGGLFTFLTFVILWRTLLQTDAPRLVTLALLVCVAVILSVSEAWRSFQTSGLENSLTHLLIALVVLETGRRGRMRPERVSALAALIMLTRLDLAVMVGPLALYALYVAYRGRTLPYSLLAYLPLAAWLLFAQLYYGTVIPNTGTSKLGVYGLEDGIRAGLVYVADWFIYEPRNALVLLVGVFAIVFGPLRASERWLALGVGLYAGSVIVGGGDFMRGRLLLPIFVAVLLLAAVAAARYSCEPVGLVRLKRGVLPVAILFTTLQLVTSPQAGYTAIRSLGPQLFGLDSISNERLYYSGQSLRHYLNGGTPLQFAKDWAPQVEPLEAFREECGGFAMLTGRIGALAYALGPGIDVVDLYGLTDNTISHLPESNYIEGSRRGHPQRLLPVSYLASRSDITLFSNWKDAVAAGDCGIITAVHAFESSDALVAPFDTAARPVYKP